MPVRAFFYGVVGNSGEIGIQPCVMSDAEFRLRIGKTEYIVSLHFAEGKKENLEDKIFRLAKNEVLKMQGSVLYDDNHEMNVIRNYVPS